MSILIKGVVMPADKAVAVVIHPDGTAYTAKMFAGVCTEYLADCAAVPVPPHGRLIDADALIDWIYSDEPNAWKAPFRLCTADRSDVKFLLKQAPTIIPASEESAKTEEDYEPWLCLSCRHYPPSSTDGKPCTQCNPGEVWHSCYDPAEEGE